MTDSRPGPDISRRCSCGVLHVDVQAHANRIRAQLTINRLGKIMPTRRPTSTEEKP